MNELQRAEYLSVMGVVSYVPRFLLPHAPAPRQAELPQEPAPESRAPEAIGPAAVTELTVAVPATPAAQLADLGILEPGTSKTTVRASDTQKTVPARDLSDTPRTEPAPAPFVLSCWWLGGELLAVDSREPGAALPVEALFNNIARALGWHQLPREQDRLRWPLAENRFGPAASAAEARDTCSAWLEAASARRPVKSIWLMGRQARDFCAPVSLENTINDWKGIRVLAMPSLSELLQQPERKRDVWQLLRQAYPEQTRAQ
ncbi:uracil-DNA glycosylase family protein [Microbulbifer thermotolerans]|uniref:Uncharacterized protein n=1 Tax=Microbulbifer thermotolerans TaxID=252514 RepID=A0A143HK62_MICTH|nr:hypothetical protein [Microbulbifer thermotolerans]AMX01662.1 hypothetical protein A3224_02880 [Microbulbifer thermotolerans]MCX2793298.1 hypothetical protein [Microbulbifer thermotolerans]